LIKTAYKLRRFPDLFGKTSRFRGRIFCRAGWDAIVAEKPIGIAAQP